MMMFITQMEALGIFTLTLMSIYILMIKIFVEAGIERVGLGRELGLIERFLTSHLT